MWLHLLGRQRSSSEEIGGRPLMHTGRIYISLVLIVSANLDLYYKPPPSLHTATMQHHTMQSIPIICMHMSECANNPRRFLCQHSLQQVMAFTNVSGDLATVCRRVNSTTSANCRMSGPISPKLQERLPTCAMAGCGVHSFATAQGASCCSNLHQRMAHQLTLSIVVWSSPGCSMHVLMALSLEL